MSFVSAAYLAMVILAFCTFGVSLLAVQIYTSLPARRRAARPSETSAPEAAAPAELPKAA